MSILVCSYGTLVTPELLPLLQELSRSKVAQCTARPRIQDGALKAAASLLCWAILGREGKRCPKDCFSESPGVAQGLLLPGVL